MPASPLAGKPAALHAIQLELAADEFRPEESQLLEGVFLLDVKRFRIGSAEHIGDFSQFVEGIFYVLRLVFVNASQIADAILAFFPFPIDELPEIGIDHGIDEDRAFLAVRSRDADLHDFGVVGKGDLQISSQPIDGILAILDELQRCDFRISQGGLQHERIQQKLLLRFFVNLEFGL